MCGCYETVAIHGHDAHRWSKIFSGCSSVPLQLTLQPKIEIEGHMAKRMALQEHLALLWSHAFIDTIVCMDPTGYA